LRVTHVTPRRLWSWFLMTTTMSFPSWIMPIMFVLRAHVPLVSLVAHLGFHTLGPLPQWALG
jgi:hypothetical protein